ncbi:zinc finger and BTB domain-containing protein 49 isoform X1 [Plutella xylostella]|uniref:zinc finger and BTB domain-containing protein 49 isoform X1 n=1 Tax=Plutella xylostella TaxID=51655 RepID=UPI00203247DE|nr:zinc finger and BTB domain-containing protein 49 isoform X1 [Plutella xylostella]
MNTETEQIFILNPSDSQGFIESQKSSETTTVNLENAMFSNICRTCATVTEFIIPIFHGEGLQNNLADKIHKHLPIQVTESDELPQVVCYQCASTLLAWHELVACCVQADAALRTRLAADAALRGTLAVDVQVDSKPGTSTDACEVTPQDSHDKDAESPSKEQPRRASFASYRRALRPPLAATSLQYTHDGSYQSDHEYADVTETGASDSDVEDNEPLANIKTQKLKTSIYKKFYSALLDFRNHYVSSHDAPPAYPDLTEPSDCEQPAPPAPAAGPLDADRFDDLTPRNMRRARLDPARRRELAAARGAGGGAGYTCARCGRRLGSAATFLLHLRTHSGERPCVCHVCGARFTAPGGLARHVAETHERRRRRACPLCAATFANSQNLKQHMRTHTGERPHACARCGKRFAQSGSLHAHLRTHSDVFPFACAQCGARFRVRAGLARHVLRHTGERAHSCAGCGRSFKHKHELRAHAHAHGAARPHACALCGAAFRQKRTLTQHCRKMHEPAPAPAAAAAPHTLIYSNVGHY